MLEKQDPQGHKFVGILAMCTVISMSYQLNISVGSVGTNGEAVIEAQTMPEG